MVDSNSMFSLADQKKTNCPLRFDWNTMLKRSPKTQERRKRENQVLAEAINACKERDNGLSIRGRCIMCMVDYPLNDGSRASGRIEEYNHCIPRSRLPGESNWNRLHSPENLAGSCRAHHHAYDRRPEIWLPIMQKIHGYNYDNDRLFKYYADKGKE
jgi:hypothetical protein